jgi:hypothetical protein
MSELPRGAAGTDDPFLVLGLPAQADQTDEDVRAAWRRIAAATHPDREDGGDPARFGAAAAAYSVLRTPFGRGEALADLSAGPGAYPRAAARHSHRRPRPGGAAPRRARIARYLGNVGRVAVGRVAAGRGLAPALAGAAVALAAAAVAFAVAGWTPAPIGLLVGAATWLLARHRGRP